MTEYEEDFIKQKINELKGDINRACTAIEWNTHLKKEAQQFLEILESILPKMKGENET